MKYFKLIVGLSALFIAGCAAYFSVSGIATLFSGSLLGVAIMASSLEIGKFVAAAFLHRNWEKLGKLVKFYLTSAVIVLMFVTSMGIFGFLSNAYQKTALKVDQVESRVEVYQQRKSGFEQDIARNSERVRVLTDQRTSQEARYDSLTANEHWVNARRTFNLIESADEEIQELNSVINTKRDSVNSLQSKIIDIRTENIDIAREIGGFKFVAEAFDVTIDTAVKWFIILLIFVFDPLAVALVIIYTSYLGKRFAKNQVTENNIIENEPDDIIETEDNEVKPEPNPKKHSDSDGLGVVFDTAQEKPNEKRNV